MGEIDKWMETQENKKYELAEEKKYNHFKYPQPRIILTAVLRTKGKEFTTYGISDSTAIPYATTRATLRKFEKMGLIKRTGDPLKKTIKADMRKVENLIKELIKRGI
jgi:DNA-binding MarR family transcriptional regulator